MGLSDHSIDNNVAIAAIGVGAEIFEKHIACKDSKKSPDFKFSLYENEIGIYDNNEIIRIDTNYYRPTEVESLLGDASKAKKELGWEPKISFKELVKEMVEKDLESIS